MRFIDKNTIKLDKDINDVDRFVFKFIKILEKHTNYVIVSGYVSILLGRDRGTDDIDIIIPKMNKDELTLLYGELIKKGYWCLNSSDLDDLYHLLTSKSSIRFAIKPRVTPNVEIKFSKNLYDDIALSKPITIRIYDKVLKTSILELQIAYKEEVLGTNKDLEDARHLRMVAKEHLNENLIKEYKKELRI